MKKKALLLLSGGLDSATVASIAKDKGYELCAISFDYGQRHYHEIEASNRVAKAAGITDYQVLALDFSMFGHSALTDPTIEVPKHTDSYTDNGTIPVTYVPARNTIFLSYALAYAETRNIMDIFIGANAVDYSGYPDCRPEYIQAYEQMANLALKATVAGQEKLTLHAPLLTMTKADIIAKGLLLGVDYSLTSSCYAPDDQGRACGQCDSCKIRLEGFAKNNRQDPIEYQKITK